MSMRYDALLVTKPENVFYLTRFPMPEDAKVLLFCHSERSRMTTKKTVLFTDTRYREEIAPLEARGIETGVVKPGTSARDALRQTLRERRVRRLAVEGGHLPVETFVRLERGMKKSGVRVTPAQEVVERMRAVKTKDEIEKIRTACQLSANALQEVVPRVRAGMRECDAAWMLEKTLREQGAMGIAFPFIVASGARGAHPHGIASEKRIARGELITIDFGAKFCGYHADMTRTFFVGRQGRLETVEKSKKVPRELKKIYLIVKQAQAAGIHAVRAGRECREIDRAARRVISRAGYGNYFVHSTGHGVGLEIHEAPTLSEKSRDRLGAGMVVTVEPGIYLPGLGGVRIEDTLMVTPRGNRILTR